MPSIASYTLPLDALASVATTAGLQWVQSDAAKIAQVQAQIAAEPKPVHVPRQRPALPPLSTEPLVLVETRKDLAAVSFAFDQPAA
jgi:ribonuclease E